MLVHNMLLHCQEPEIFIPRHRRTVIRLNIQLDLGGSLAHEVVQADPKQRIS